MKKTVWLMGILTLGVIMFGFNSKVNGQQQERAVEQKNGSNSDRDLALKFLQGIQEGDKQKMYEAANLTTEIVNDSKERLIRSNQDKLTEQQRKEFEFILKISGQIDFFFKRLPKMFPKSSRIEIAQTTVKASAEESRHVFHRVKITYLNKAEAMRDKKGKLVKQMAVQLQQLTRSAGSRSVQEFGFSEKDFDKIADKDFNVLSYF
jgi:hypothetical protein